ncbi:MAG: GH92 family glycosyl hydrolase [Opitutaceae bacterium]|jgi:predicted alpha-1,2-mannosidase
MNSKPPFSLFLLGLGLALATSGRADEATRYVNPMIGTGSNGMIAPAAGVPFGMVQLGPDTRVNGSGYNYRDQSILGFSHVHKSGGGCGDFLDILFQPVPGTNLTQAPEEYPILGYASVFSHATENVAPGFYSVTLDDFHTRVSLTASSRCGLHKYEFPHAGPNYVMIDLNHGNQGACTILPEENGDRVISAEIKVISDRIVEGHRISQGWAPEQHVYFYAEFSRPFKTCSLYNQRKAVLGATEASSTDIRAVLCFETDDQKEVLVKVGISSVSAEGARRNLRAELPDWNFPQARSRAAAAWSKELSIVHIEDAEPKHKEIFYTGLYNILRYPMLYSDVDGNYRGPDHQVHHASGFDYYGGVVGIWDTFRAATPLLTILRPDVANDYVQTFLEHYRHFGQLPIWVLAGNETFQMIGLPAMPIIADCYFKGIRNYDAEAVFEAMKQSAMKDFCGTSMGYFVGLKNYKKYAYIPADMEMESVARTLEYAYDDWCIAQMAKMLGKTNDYNYFIKRSENYKSLLDPDTLLMRGRLADGSWRTPFDPLFSNHRRDDYCEGDAWQWSFFVPHDVIGLAESMGGKQVLISQLDSLFTLPADLHGPNTSKDAITGMIGQYAHGNEPGHHTIYMYDYLGQPWKTQQYVRQVMDTLYDDTPTGICGNEDTGQMSAWYVWSAMGFYPVRHGTGEYMIGTPLFKHLKLTHARGKLVINAPDVSAVNKYIKSIKLNGKTLSRFYLMHDELFGQDALLEFEMISVPQGICLKTLR